MINYIAFIIIIIFLIIFVLLSILLLPIGYLLSVINKKLSYAYANKIVKCVFIVIKFFSMTKVNIAFNEKLNKNENYFYVANHRGIFDVILLYPLIKNSCIIIAKDTMKKNLFIYLWMNLLGCYFLDRNNMRSGFKMVVYSIEMLKNNISVLIFPEGTRNKNNDYKELLEFKEGCFAIPNKAKKKVVPIAIYDTYPIFEENKMLRCKKNIKIVIGKAEYIVDDNNKNGEYFRDKIKEMMN